MGETVIMCSQIFTDGRSPFVYRMVSKKVVGQALSDFTDDVGIPDKLIHDGAAEMTGRNTDFQRDVRRLKIMTQVTEQGCHNQNHRAEGDINELKNRWRRRMASCGAPRSIWDLAWFMR